MPTLYGAMRHGLISIPDAATTQTGDSTRRDAIQRHTDETIECLATHPAAPDRFFVGTFDNGLHRSIDGGDTMERIDDNAFESERVTALAIYPADPDIVWTGTEPSAVYRSADGGESWTARPGIRDLPSADEWYFPPRPDTHHVRWIEPDPNRDGRLYVGIEAGALVRTDDGGKTWQDRPNGARRDNHHLATHRLAPDRVYAAAGDGYAESDDGGDSWQYPQKGLDHTYCWNVAIAPDDPDAMVLASASGAGAAHSPPDATSYIYRRTADGWEQSMDGLPGPDGMARAVLAVAGDGRTARGRHQETSNSAGVFYALTNHGVYQSSDGGRSWTALDTGFAWNDRFVSQTPRGLVVV